MFMMMFIICQNLNTILLYKNGYLQMVHNSNMKTQTHQRNKLTKTFSNSSFEKVKIKLSNISDPFVKNLSTKLWIVGFGGARATLKCSLNFC